MPTYKIARNGDVLSIGFGDERAKNPQIVKDVVACLEEMSVAGQLEGGGLIKVNGPASLPVAMVLAHKLSHLFGAVACFDPKENTYVVVISHDPSFTIGEVLQP